MAGERRWLRGFLLLGAAASACMVSSCGGGGRLPGGGGGSVNDLLLELEAFVPWSEEGLPEEIMYPGMRAPDGSPVVGGRQPPQPLLAADGTLWLARPGLLRAVRLTGGRTGEPFALDEAGLDRVFELGAAGDGGLVLLGRDNEEIVLARLSGAGALAWRRDDLPPAQAGCARAQLAVDHDGSVYLFTADRPAGEGGTGEVLRVDLEDGGLSRVLSFEEKPPRDVWVREGMLYRVLYADEMRYWVSYDVATGEERATAACAALFDNLGWAEGPVPGGGALLGELFGDSLIWMGADGEEMDRVGLVSAVRVGEGVAAAVREGGVLTLARWADGELTDAVEIDEPDEHVDLIYVDGDEYYLWGRETGIIAVDGRGRLRVVTGDPSEVNRLRKERAGGLGYVAVDWDGSVLLTGSDPEGAFVIRLTRR